MCEIEINAPLAVVGQISLNISIVGRRIIPDISVRRVNEFLKYKSEREAAPAEYTFRDMLSYAIYSKSNMSCEEADLYLSAIAPSEESARAIALGEVEIQEPSNHSLDDASLKSAIDTLRFHEIRRRQEEVNKRSLPDEPWVYTSR